MSHPQPSSGTDSTIARPHAARWTPSLGAWLDRAHAHFRVWAPTRSRVSLVLDPLGSGRRELALALRDAGVFEADVPGVAPGELYVYSPDGEGPFPDPASRSQPLGVHGPSAIVDPHAFTWSDATWRGVALERAVFYELHVGAFTPAGTFAGVTERLDYLAGLGVTAIELMPVAAAPGSRNWGYDGASLFAPSAAYGTPDDLRALVDRAHSLGLALVLDVVYNHLGPDGAYAAAFSPRFFSKTHHNPWGDAINFDGKDSRGVREFFIENALHWLHEYHVDGFRLDATHAIHDGSSPHFLEELTARLKASAPGRTVLVIAEDDRNLSTIVTPAGSGGWGLDAVWADDFHHQVRRRAAGDADGYYADYSGSLRDLAETIRAGWLYSGQFSSYRGEARGTETTGVPRQRMVICLQNHDQVGNRAFGDRLTASVSLQTFRALSALLLFLPETPLLFMGQEWASSSPFLYFTDHEAELGRLVTEGRRAEFARFDQFADPGARARIPDPQAISTFTMSRLDWDESRQTSHGGVLALYRALLAIRRQDAALEASSTLDVAVDDEASCLSVKRSAGRDALTLVVHLPERHRTGRVTMHLPDACTLLLDTDDPRFGGAERSSTGRLTGADQRLLGFDGPASVILRHM
ncbi:MAG: malto-oligosyltrehalose trehalohydrolase [Vicinamibacterales bacterium]